ncbi:MAG: DUF898 family protein [Alphaproteobacteria bacterium]|jgi:uncharacterized membrane protein YjgN (DUF898 family)
MPDSAAAPAMSDAPTTPVAFTGERGELTGIVIANAFLTLITLGIYRFWAKTAIREYYWQNTLVGGDAFEYTGRGVELFLGFLIAMVVLTIVSVIVATAQFMVGLENIVAGQALEFVTYILFAWLLGYAVYRARRYRLTRTLWRGIRFGQDGSPARYAWMRFGWLLLLIVTLGAVRPWYEVALRRYEMAHTRFGFTRFDYGGRGRDLMRYWWPAFAVLLVTLVAFAGVAGGIGILAEANGLPDGHPEEFETVFEDALQHVWIQVGLAVIVAGYIAFALLDARFRVAALRYLFAVSSLNGVTARSEARLGRILLYVFVSTGVILALFGWAVLMVAVADGLGILFMIIAVFAIGPVNQLFFVYPLVRHVATTLETAELAALDDIVQATRDDPRFGEGLLDALDLDMGVV